MLAKKKLLLVNPPANPDVGSQLHMENLGLGYVAASVRRALGHSHEVALWDCSMVDHDGRHIGALLRSHAPDVLGLTLSTMNAQGGLRIAAQARAYAPFLPIVIGGILPTCLPAEELAGFSPDVIIRGEGEVLVLAALGALEALPRGQRPETPLEMSQDEPLDVDALAWPARDMLPWQLRFHPQASIATSRGCPFGCSFCSIPKPGGKRLWRPRTIEDVVEEMVWLRDRHGVAHFYFVDDNFLLPAGRSQERAARFAALALARLPDIRFGFMCRSAAVEPQLFALLKRAGLSGVFLGIESFSQPVLDRYRKQEKVEEHLSAIAALNELGITVNPGFIFFDPWTTVSEINDNIDVMGRLHFESLESVNSRLTCYKGSAIAEEVDEDTGPAPAVGIRHYAMRDAAARRLYDVCCRFFSAVLPSIASYRQYKQDSYCLGYLLPYFQNGERQSLFENYYRQSQTAWKQGDAVALGLLRACANAADLDPEAAWSGLAEEAQAAWSQGNEVASRFFRLARIVALKQAATAGPSQAWLAALAFTSPRADLDLDLLLSAVGQAAADNRTVLAGMLAHYRGRQPQTHLRALFGFGDDGVAAKALDGGMRLFCAPVVALVEDYLARRGAGADPALVVRAARAKALFRLRYPEFILAMAEDLPEPACGTA